MGYNARDLRSRGWNSANSAYRAQTVPRSTGGNLSSRAYPSSLNPTSQPVSLTGSKTNTNTGTGTGGGRKTGIDTSALAGLYAYNQKNNLAQQLYDKNMGALNAAFDNYLGALADNLASTKSTLLESYNTGKKGVLDEAAQSLKQAYVNKMLSEKNLDQRMAAQGLSGGATETTRASMSNNYGNARNEIDRTTNNNLAALASEYNSNVAAAMQAYNQAVAQAELQRAQQAMEIENNLYNNQMDAAGDYAPGGFDDGGQFQSAMAAILQNSGQVELDPIQILNNIQAMELTQPGSLDNRSYNNLLAALSDIINGKGASNPYAMALVKQLSANRG